MLLDSSCSVNLSFVREVLSKWWLGHRMYSCTAPSVQLQTLMMRLKLADNIFGVLPDSSSKTAAVWLMIIHQFIAFALYVLPLLYMW